MAERVKFEVETARQLFLYGAGDGKRVLNPHALAEASGLHISTIQRWMKTWLAEAEQLLSGASTNGLALNLSKDTMSLHKSNMVFLEKQLQVIKYELDTMDTITEKLEAWLDKFSGENEFEKAIQIFHDWQRASGTKSSLRSQFLALQKQHATLSGIVDLKDIEVVRAKEISKGKAKLEMQKLSQQEAANGGEIRNATPISFFETVEE